MRKAKLAFFTGIIVLGMVVQTLAADVAKIGVIDLQRVLDISAAGKKAQAEVNRKGQEMEKDLKSRGEEIEALSKKLEREAVVMSKEMRAEKEREGRILVNDFKTLQKKYKNELRQLERNIIRKIREEIFKMLEEIGKREGYLLIIEKREGGLIYSPTTIDITDEFVKIYNARFAEKNIGQKKQ